MRRGSLHATMIALAAAALIQPGLSRAANLWIAFEPGTDGMRADYEDFFACVTGATNFNTLIAGYGGGPLVFAGDAVVGHCGVNNWTCPVSMATCVVRSASFAPRIQAGDTVLYVNSGSCGGWNDRRVLVPVGATTVPIHFGEIGNGGTFRCQTWTGMHEVYEANTNGISADCCSHETHFNGGNHPECAATAGQSANGTYSLMGCSGRSFVAEELSPVGHDTDLAACAQVTVDTTSLCAQPRAARDLGVCMGGNVVRCSLGPTTEDCHGRGCSDTPTPHCNGFDASCTLEYPATMCGGETASAVVHCTNTGDVAWNGDVQLGAVPQGTASPFADPGWIASDIAATVSPAAVPAGATGAFAFRLHAPTLALSHAYTLQWSLVHGGAYQPSPAPATLTMAIMVDPCDSDASTDGGAEAAADSGTTDGSTAMFDAARADVIGRDSGATDASAREAGDGGTGAQTAGCGCRARPTRPSGLGVALIALGFGVVRRRRRARGASRAVG